MTPREHLTKREGSQESHCGEEGGGIEKGGAEVELKMG
jgi:hypothetical protein